MSKSVSKKHRRDYARQQYPSALDVAANSKLYLKYCSESHYQLRTGPLGAIVADIWPGNCNFASVLRDDVSLPKEWTLIDAVIALVEAHSKRKSWSSTPATSNDAAECPWQ